MEPSTKATPPSSLQVLLTTNLASPTDIDELYVEARLGGAPFWSKRATSADGSLRWPALYELPPPKDATGLVEMRVVAGKDGVPQVLSEARTRFPSTGSRVVRLGLSSLCRGAKSIAPSSQGWDVKSPCPPTSTCIAGECAAIPDLGSDSVDLPLDAQAVSEGCWDPTACFQGSSSLDPYLAGSTCVASLPKGSGPPRALAVASTSDPTEACQEARSCYFPLSRGDGPGEWTTEGGFVHLPRVLCEGSPLRIVVSDRCGAWTEREPVCVPRGPPSFDAGSPPSARVPDSTPPSGTEATVDGGTPIESSSSEGGSSVGRACTPGLAVAPPGTSGYIVEGSVSGLSEEGLVLLLNRQEGISIPKGATHFSFSAFPRPAPSLFEVSIERSPPNLYCHVVAASGGMGQAKQPRVECLPRPPISHLSVGPLHTCIAMGNGTVRCWGQNATGATAGATMAYGIQGIETATRVSAGRYQSCAVLRDTTVRCWGGDTDGALGGSSIVASIPGLSGVVDVGTGYDFSCALLEDTTVRCWGTNRMNQCANSSTERSIEGLSGVVQLAVGAAHACVRMADSTVRCWGESEFVTGGSSPNHGIEGLSGVTSLSLGQHVSCALLKTGAVRCWADGVVESYLGGIAGRGTTTDLEGLTGIVEVVVGQDYNLWARDAKGTLRCRGFPLTCPTGLGPPVDSIVEMGAGYDYVCARTSDHRIVCWGASEYGTFTGSHRPRAVRGLSGAVDIALSGAMGGALFRDGSVRFWGAAFAHVFEGVPGSITERVSNLGPASAISVGSDQACVVLANGTLACHGRDHFVPDNPVLFSDEPLAGLAGVVGVSSSWARTCVLLADSTVRCWGANSNGETAGSSTKESIVGLSGVAKVAAGTAMTCALMKDETLRCWGYTVGDLQGATPVWSIPGLSGIRDITVGDAHVCALLRDSSVRCLGANANGELAGSSASESIVGLSGVTQVRAGMYHTCALLLDGSVRCWGAHGGDETGGATPRSPVPFVENAVAIGAGAGTSCALGCNGDLLCWGNNAGGQASGGNDYRAETVPIPP